MVDLHTIVNGVGSYDCTHAYPVPGITSCPSPAGAGSQIPALRSCPLRAFTRLALRHALRRCSFMSDRTPSILCSSSLQSDIPTCSNGLRGAIHSSWSDMLPEYIVTSHRVGKWAEGLTMQYAVVACLKAGRATIAAGAVARRSRKSKQPCLQQPLPFQQQDQSRGHEGALVGRCSISTSALNRCLPGMIMLTQTTRTLLALKGYKGLLQIYEAQPPLHHSFQRHPQARACTQNNED